MWNGYGIYHLHQAIPSDNSCDGQWVQTTLTGTLNYDWQRLDGVHACAGVHPIKYQKDSSLSKVQFCCPDFPYTKKAKKCDRNDKNLGCNKFAKEWKGDGICDLEDCGNCPAMWDYNKFDGGDCGYVEWESAEGQAVSEMNEESLALAQGATETGPGVVATGLALIGLGAMVYGAGQYYFKQQ